MKKLLFHKITDRTAKLGWLFALWCATYVFTVWAYGSFHFLRPRDTPEQTFYVICILITWGVLLIEFSLNFPCKHLVSRILWSLAALIGLMAALPTL